MTDRARSEYVIRIEHLTRIYGPNKSEAARLMEAGLSKNEVFK